MLNIDFLGVLCYNIYRANQKLASFLPDLVSYSYPNPGEFKLLETGAGEINCPALNLYSPKEAIFMNNRDNKTIRRRHVRWDRVFGLILVLASLITIIVLALHSMTGKAEEKDNVAVEPQQPAESYFEEAIQPNFDVVTKDQKAKPMLLSGADISKHNGEIITDGDFVIIKATEGIGYVDPRFEENIQKAIDNNQLCGVYHFARPDTNLPSVEAEHFVETIRPYLGKVMLVLDWEKEEEIDNTVWVAAWMWQVYKMTGVRPVLYTSASVAQDYDWTGVSSEFDLWVACYVQDSAEFPCQEIPYDLSAWRTIIWQYSTAGDLDHNICSLTTEEWQNRCAVTDIRSAGVDLAALMSLSARAYD